MLCLCTGCGIQVRGTNPSPGAASVEPDDTSVDNDDPPLNSSSGKVEPAANAQTDWWFWKDAGSEHSKDGDEDSATSNNVAGAAPQPTPEELAAAEAERKQLAAERKRLAAERKQLLAQRAQMPVIDIDFDDLKLEVEENIKFDREMLTDRARELEGHRVRIRGYISGTVLETEGITNFPLMRNTECRFGVDAAHHNVQVAMASDRGVNFTVLPIAVEGILSVAPYNGPDGITYSIYRLRDAQLR